MKKVLILLLIIITFGCSSSKVEKIEKANGEAKTYKFFKNINVKHYYISFWDRNISINDDTEVIFARDNDKYYYEIKGENNQKIIQKEGIRYTINDYGYLKEEKEIEDYSKGIIPKNIEKLKTQGYKRGKEKVYNKYYTFEEYINGKEKTTYYYGKNLSYIKYSSIEREVMLKFKEIKYDFSDKIFEIDKSLMEIAY